MIALHRQETRNAISPERPHRHAQLKPLSGTIRAAELGDYPTSKYAKSNENRPIFTIFPKLNVELRNYGILIELQ
jgi:hypothetical protein